MRMFTRGRLVPRQPRAIKRTTRTELHHEGIYIAKFIHWDNSAIPTQLQDEIIVSVTLLIIILQTTPSISKSNHSPPSSGRGWGGGWKALVSRLYFPHTILHFILNHVTLTIVSSRNSVRVVLLIARGWRGTSLPRGNVRKEMQRRRCWAFSMKARL